MIPETHTTAAPIWRKEQPLEMYELTREDVKVIRKATALCVYLRADLPEGKVRFLERVNLDTKEKETVLPIPVRENVYRTNTETGKRVRVGENFEMVHLYPGFQCKPPATSVLHSLKAGDSVTFEFYADAHSNAYMAEKGLHGDALWLYVRRKGAKTMETFEVESSATPENSARMCQGVPFSGFLLSKAEVMN